MIEEDDEDDDDDKKMKEKSNSEFISENPIGCIVDDSDVDQMAIVIYHSLGSYNCEKVLMYLHERGIPFQEHEVNLKICDYQY